MTSCKTNLPAICTLLMALALPTSALALTSSEVESELMCTCGCSMVLNTCSCGTADQMRKTIRTMIREGKTKKQIINGFVLEAGDSILSSPPRKGFNMVAYAAPVVGLAFGGLIAVIFVRRWTTSSGSDAEDREDGGTEGGVDLITDEMQKKIDEELRKIEED